MTIQANSMAALAGWLEDECGENQAQYILGHIAKMQRQDQVGSLQCMEIMLLAEVIHGYRKEMLHQIKEYKFLRAKEYEQDVASLNVRKELRNMKEAIIKGLTCWLDLREIYFFERVLYMKRCKWPYSAAVCLSNPLYEQII